MNSSKESIKEIYGNKLRVRSCGIHIKENKILLLKHSSINQSGVFWSPPGGGINFGEPATVALKREFLEETNLNIKVKSHLFSYEYIKNPLHALELYFEVEILGGKLEIGFDPEMENRKQILLEAIYLSLEEILKMPKGDFHPIFNEIENLNDFFKLKSVFIQ